MSRISAHFLAVDIHLASKVLITEQGLPFMLHRELDMEMFLHVFNPSWLRPQISYLACAQHMSFIQDVVWYLDQELFPDFKTKIKLLSTLQEERVQSGKKWLSQLGRLCPLVEALLLFLLPFEDQESARGKQSCSLPAFHKTIWFWRSAK